MNTAIEMSLLAEAEFKQFQNKWNDLLERSNLSSYFLKWEWLYSFWETLPYKNCELRIYVFKEGTRLVGLFPLYLQKTFLNKVPVRKLLFLGDKVSSDHMDLICLPGYEAVCTDLFYHNVIASNKKDFDMIEFQSIRADFHLLNYLKKKERECFLKEIKCPRIALPESYEKYLEGYKSKKRYWIKKLPKKLYKDFKSVKVEFHSPGKKITLLNILFDLHKKRRDSLRYGKSSFCNDYRRKFNNSLLDKSLDGDVLFSTVKIKDEIVSILYMFVYKGTLYQYQSGWLPEYAMYTIGLFHLYEVIKYAIGKGYSTFDLLRGDESYKYSLKGEDCKTYTLLCFNQSITGMFHKYFYLFSKRVKWTIKKCLLM